jgi:transketolase
MFILNQALKAADKLEEDGIFTTVTDMFTLKHIDETTITEAAKKTRCILSVEEHSIIYYGLDMQGIYKHAISLLVMI